jgi:hypothetical protein
MTAIELKNYFRSTLTARRTIAQEYSALDAIVDFISQSLSTGIPEWTNVLAFNNNGSGAGAFTTYPATTGALRFWNSKTNGNTGNQPPTDPLVTENTYWKEVSPSDGSSIKEWAAGVYLSGLQIVFYSHSIDGDGFYKLTEATRPFTSANIETEITSGKWVKIGALASQAEVNAENDDSKPITAKKLSEKPIKQETYNPTLSFTKNLRDVYIDQSSTINLDATFSGAIHGAEKNVMVNGDTVNTLTFSSKFEKFVGSLDFDNTKLNHIICTYNSYAGKIYYYIAHTSRVVVDTVPPSIISSALQASNVYIDITFNEGVFTNTGGSGGLSASDFALVFNQNGGTATACTIAGVKKNDGSTLGAASALVGGESTVRIFLTLTGSPSGTEFISLTPATSSSIYDAAGNAMPTSQTTGNKNLNGIDTTAPQIVSAVLASNNAYIDVNFSEGVYTDVSRNPPVVADFTLTFAQNGGTATACTISSIVTTAGGSLGGGESTIRFNLTITGTVNGAETITIKPASGAAIYDYAGNVMVGTETTGAITLNNFNYSVAAAAVFALMPDAIGTALKNAMATFIDSQVTSGNWTLLDCFQFYGLNTEINSLKDWKGNFNASLVNGANWNSGSNVNTDGVNDYVDTGFIPSSATKYLQDNARTGVWVKTWGHAAGVTKILFGCGDGTRFTSLAESSANVLNRTMNSTSTSASYNGETVFSNGALYEIKRVASTTSTLEKNGSNVDSDSQTSNGRPTTRIYLGARNNNGTADLFSNSQFICFYAGQGTTFDAANFYSNLQTLISTVGA